jgi:hypothetical protein
MRVRQALLDCGIVSSLLHVPLNILGAIVWQGYSPISQAISELCTIGAPSRRLVTPLMVVYNFLLYAFGLAVWLSARPKTCCA